MALSDDAKDLKGVLREVQAAMEAARKSGLGIADGMSASKDALAGLLGAAQQFTEYQESSTGASYEQLKALQEKFKTEKENLSISQQALIAQKTLAEKQKLSNESLIKSLKLKEKSDEISNSEIVDLKEAINKNKELKQTIAEQGIQMAQNELILKNVGGAVQQLESDLDKAAKKAKDIEGFEKAMGGFGKAIDSVRTPLDGLLNPLNLINTIISFVFGQFKEVDEAAGKTAKSMNISYNEAVRMREEMAAAADASGELTLNSKAMEATLVNINAALGSSVKYSDLSEPLKKDIQLMSQLEAAAGLTGEQSQAIMKYSMGTGQHAKDVTKELMASYKVQGLKSGLVLNEKDAMKAIEKTSKAIQMSYGGNAKELGKALAAAKGLGVELNKVDDIAGSLLDFEQSIENELSAELLLGKDINLEKARQAALNGDLATVAEEITKQVGSAAEFNKMNRLQQEAMAKAIGMSREELAGALMEQTALKNIGAESIAQAQEQYNLAVKEGREKEFLNELGDEALGKQLEQTSVAEKAQLAQQKMADETMPAIANTLTKVSDNFEDIFKKVKSIIDRLGGMKTVMMIIAGIMTAKIVKGIMDFTGGAMKAYQWVKKMKQAEEGAAKLSLIKGAWSSSGIIPFVGAGLAIAAIAAGIALISSISNTGDDVLSSSLGDSGYGKRVLFGPEGAIKLNNKDTIVAGTDLFADDAVMEPGKATQSANKGEIKIKSEGGGGQDMSAMVSAITSLANRPINNYMDGEKVGEASFLKMKNRNYQIM